MDYLKVTRRSMKELVEYLRALLLRFVAIVLFVRRSSDTIRSVYVNQPESGRAGAVSTGNKLNTFTTSS